MTPSRIALIAVAVLVVGWAAYATWTRRQEDAALRAGALAACTRSLANDACAAAITRDHDECRLLATTYRGKNQGPSTIDPNAFADCITRGPTAVQAERAALRRAEQERRSGALR